MTYKSGFICVIFIAISITNALPQTVEISEKNNKKAINFSPGEHSKNKDLDICFSHNKSGQISKISITPHLIKETGLSLIIDRETMLDTINEIVPESIKGEKLRQYTSFLGKASIESFIYKNVQIDLTNVCDEEICGISYAEIRWK